MSTFNLVVQESQLLTSDKKKCKKVSKTFGRTKNNAYLCNRKNETGKSHTVSSLGTPPGWEHSKGTWS